MKGLTPTLTQRVGVRLGVDVGVGVRLGVRVGVRVRRRRASDDEADEGCDDALDLVEEAGVDLFDVAPSERHVEACANLAGRAEGVEVARVAVATL